MTALSQPIGHAISAVLLGLIYYGLITPLALLFRIAGRDPLARRAPALASYWEAKSEPRDVRRYLRQYQSQASGAMKAEVLKEMHYRAKRESGSPVASDVTQGVDDGKARTSW
jgi:hypothetical protein